MLGDTSYEVAFVWLVLSVTRSPAALGAVMLAATIPRGLLLLVGGAITDRLSPRLLMLAAHLTRGRRDRRTGRIVRRPRTPHLAPVRSRGRGRDR